METFSKGQASIRDVAAAAGVSTATVSRVMKGGPVSEQLKERVEAAVRQTGYRPNLAARRLRTQHSQTIGLIVSDIRNPFFTALSRSVEEEAFKADMRVVLCNTDENPERERIYLGMMQEERITGLIFAPTRHTAQRLETIDFPFPVVFVDRAGPVGAHDQVALDNMGATEMLVSHLAARGHQRIGGLFGNTSSTAVERQRGYMAAMAEHGLKPESRLVVPSTDAAFYALSSWIAEGDFPDAFMGSNSLIVLGMVRAARAAGLTIPDDIALAGFDNEPWTEMIGSGLTVIEQPVDEIGRSAMALLFERLERPQATPRKIVLPGRLIPRG